MAEHQSPFHPERIVHGLETLIGREHVSEDYVRFRIELFKAQSAIRDALQRSAPSSGTCGHGKSHSGRAPLEPHDVLFEPALLGKLLEDLSAALGKQSEQSEMLARLSAATGDDPALLEELAGKAAFEPDRQLPASSWERLDVDPQTLLFFGRVLAAPFVARAVGRLKQSASPPAESSGRCPWCDSPPGLAKLARGDGRRLLFCSLCGEGWPLGRLRCPFCKSQQSLGVLSFEAADPCRIETCEVCEGYLKTIDERKLPDEETVVPLVWATATLYLDLIAEAEGCRRGLPYVALQ